MLMTLSTSKNDILPATFNKYDVLFEFGNIYSLSQAQQDAITGYVSGGGGFVGMHVTSWTFRPYPQLYQMMGGAFLGHLARKEFGPYLSAESHPITENLGVYTSNDEPYEHQYLQSDITVLTYAQVRHAEPFSWVRDHGNGRVFYNASGHDLLTWQQPNFMELMMRGTSWVAKAGDGDLLQTIDSVLVGQGGAMVSKCSVLRSSVIHQAVISGGRGGMSLALIEGREVFDRNGKQFQVNEGPRSVGGSIQNPKWMLAGAASQNMADIEGVWSMQGILGETESLTGELLSPGSSVFVVGNPTASVELVMTQSGDWASRVFTTTAVGGSISGSAVVLEMNGSQSVIIEEGQATDFHGASNAEVARIDIPSLRIFEDADVLSVFPVRAISDQSPLGEKVMHYTNGAWLDLLETGVVQAFLNSNEVFLSFHCVEISADGWIAVIGDVGLLGASGDVAVALRNPQGAWLLGFREGVQTYLASGEVLSVGADEGFLLANDGNLFIRGSIVSSSGSEKAIIRQNGGGSGKVLGRVNEVINTPEGAFSITNLGELEEIAVDNGSTVVMKAGGILGALSGVRTCLLCWQGDFPRVLEWEGKQHNINGVTKEVTQINWNGGFSPSGGRATGLSCDSHWGYVVDWLSGGQSILAGKSVNDWDNDDFNDLLEMALAGDVLAYDSYLAGAPRFVKQTDKVTYYRQNGVQNPPVLEFSADLSLWAPYIGAVTVSADQTGLPVGFTQMEISPDVSAGHLFYRLRLP